MKTSSKKLEHVLSVINERIAFYDQQASDEWLKNSNERDENYRQYCTINKTAYKHCAQLLQSALE